MHMSDQDILVLFRQNEIKKGVKGVYAFYPPIRKMVVANSGNKLDAEDLFQEVLVVLMDKVKQESFELKSALSTYLYAIARNLWLKELRSRGKVVAVELEEERIEIEDALDLETEKHYSIAEKALKQLGEKCQQLLVLFYYHRMSFDLIAKKLEFRNDKVAKNQKYRCLEKAKSNFSLLNAN